MSVVAPPEPRRPEGSELLIREARARQRKRRTIAAAALALVSAVAVGVSGIVSGGGSSARDSGNPASASTTSGPCRGVRVVGRRILYSGRVVYTAFATADYRPVGRGPAHEVQCSGATVWVVFGNGGLASQENYVGVRSDDRGRSWHVVFAEGFFGVQAPHRLVVGYLGPWTLRGPRAAYFVGDCVACGRGTTSLWVTTDGGRTFRRYPVPWPEGATSASVRVQGHTVDISAHHVQVS